ncbi:unnamed protein product [Clonostachys rosea f. rosea IK726]|uniref:Uncharacterized protein n=2 Tax=Bionectria ochroleuca TaxID=29856 RepID=A0A0B7JQZ8_BIOOC|nr:unnamed protein product [Clonostachys rosea f. rosea IK726]
MFKAAPQAQAAPTERVAFYSAPPAPPTGFASIGSTHPASFGGAPPPAPLTSATYVPSGSSFGGSVGDPGSSGNDDFLSRRLSAPLLSRKKKKNPDVLSTVCAVVFLRVRLAGEKEAWEMIASKAVSWLEEQLGSEEEITKWELVLEGLFAGSN